MMTTPRNILFLLIDDLGWRDLSCFGSSFYETPNLDALAASGLRFQNAYASCPVCSPTRASILSGKYPARVGVTQWIGGSAQGRLLDVPYLHYLPLEEVSIATALREAGYQTWHVGKWHLGDEAFGPEQHGFDVNIGGSHCGSPSTYFSPWQLANLPEAEDGTYLTDHLTDRAIHLIQNRDPARPFFLNLSHYAVHTPIEAPEHLVEKYRKKAIRLGLDQVDPILEGEHFPCEHKADRRVKRRILQSDPTYAAMLENLDQNIGRLLAALQAEGLEEETMVVFTSDNGGLSTAESSPTCNHPLSEGKGWLEEGGTRVCQMIRLPGFTQPGSVTNEPVTSTDFYPTLLEVAGCSLRPQQHIDGVSLMPILAGNQQIEREAIFWHYPHYANQGGTPGASVVAGKWKLLHLFENEEDKLFDLANDPSEAQDLRAQHPDLAAHLRSLLREWQAEVEAKIPLENPDWLGAGKLRPRVPNNAAE